MRSTYLSVVVLVLSGCSRPAPKPASGKVSASSTASREKPSETKQLAPEFSEPPGAAVTRVSIRNVVIRDEPASVVHVRMMEGYLKPKRPAFVPSFDDKQSFTMMIDSAVLAITTDDLAALLNNYTFAYDDSPISNIKVTVRGKKLDIHATVHKGIPVPVQMNAELAVVNDGKIKVHLEKIHAVHMPVRGLMHLFGIKPGDLIDSQRTTGMSVQGDDIYVDPLKILPPPRHLGRLTKVYLRDGELVQEFGHVAIKKEMPGVARNYMHFRGGTIQFGRLQMMNADLMMVGIDTGPWFHFNLDHYRQQLELGSIKVTPMQGLIVYMPELASALNQQQTRSKTMSNDH